MADARHPTSLSDRILAAEEERAAAAAEGPLVLAKQELPGVGDAAFADLKPAEVATPLTPDEVPTDSFSPAFTLASR